MRHLAEPLGRGGLSAGLSFRFTVRTALQAQMRLSVVPPSSPPPPHRGGRLSLRIACHIWGGRHLPLPTPHEWIKAAAASIPLHALILGRRLRRAGGCGLGSPTVQHGKVGDE